MAKVSARRSVLLVDRSADQRELYAVYLRRAGFRVLEAGTVEGALAKGREASIVVTELWLGKRGDGFRLVRRLRKGSSPLIVALTASAMSIDRSRALAAGCDAFLAKPCLPRDLLIVIGYLTEIEAQLRAPKKTVQLRSAV